MIGRKEKVTQLGVFQTNALTWGSVQRNSVWVVVLSDHRLSEAVILRLRTLVYFPHSLLLVLWYKTLSLIVIEELSNSDCF